jgi:hypothetical protein
MGSLEPVRANEAFAVPRTPDVRDVRLSPADFPGPDIYVNRTLRYIVPIPEL